MNTLFHRLCYRKTYGLSMHFGENDKGLPKGSPFASSVMKAMLSPTTAEASLRSLRSQHQFDRSTQLLSRPQCALSSC